MIDSLELSISDRSYVCLTGLKHIIVGWKVLVEIMIKTLVSVKICDFEF